MNYCQAGHQTHHRKIVPSKQGDFLIYDWKQYMNFKGYCMGQDDISRTIDLYGLWSDDMYDFISKILTNETTKKVFIDVGSHIGWFSKLAINLGYEVIGFEGVSENIELAKVNALQAAYKNVWFDKNILPSDDIFEAHLMKIDVEANERYVVDYFDKSFSEKSIDNVVMEISPVFNDSYPAIVEKMKTFGYEVLLLDGTKWDGNFNFNQTDFWFRKQ